jgi:hypothetical protein
MQAKGSPVSTGRQPTDIGVADVNRDGEPDLVTANAGSRDLTVLLGDGSGGFRPAPGSPVPAGMPAHLLVLGDLNRDGNPDMAVTCHDSNTVAVLLGDGTGRFSRRQRSHFPALRGGAAHNHGLALGDVNGDGNPDIVTSNHRDGSVSVLVGDGKAGFAPAAGSPFAVGRGPYPLALADLNGDSKLDIATPNVADNSVSLLFGDGKAGFEPSPGSPIATEFRPYFIAAGDINGDGKPDIVTSHDDRDFVAVLIGGGRGTFVKTPNPPVEMGGRAGEVVLVDLDGNGTSDIVAGTGQDVVVVKLSDGKGGFRQAAGSPFPAGNGPWAVTVADLNGDRKSDIITANFEGNSISILLHE